MRMMSTSRAAVAMVAIAGAAAVTSHAQGARQGQGSGAAGAQGEPRAVAPIEDTYFPMPVPAADHAYSAIDGKRLHAYVVEQSGISRRYRDQGHPQFWGRIIGTSSDTESAQWLLDKFKELGLTDTRIQPVDLAAAVDAAVVGSDGHRRQRQDTASRRIGAAGLRHGGHQAEGLDVEAVYVGLGSEADFAGRDVRGKAALIVSMPQAGSRGRANRRAQTGRGTRRRRDLRRAGPAGQPALSDLPGRTRTCRRLRWAWKTAWRFAT